MSKRDDMPVAVIGSGLGGLAAACTAAARGHKVVLLEANDWVGGKAAVLEEDGFRRSLRYPRFSTGYSARRARRPRITST